jgi:putative copper resistance protein D
MSAFSPTLTDLEIWNVVQLVRFQGDALDALTMTDHVEPWRPLVAPDFTFERATHEQQTLADEGKRRITLVVLYAQPRSLPRLRELAEEHRALAAAGVRVVAIPLDAGSVWQDATNADARSILAIATPEAPKVYAMFARRGNAMGDVASEHAELLIDRQGYLRARWIGSEDTARGRTAAILAEVEVLVHERPHAPTTERHAH